MNRRDYKEFSKDSIYHIYNRGVNKMDIFKKEYDFRVFLYRLKENLFPNLKNEKNLSKTERRRKPLPPNSFDLICYCLMPNHFHLLIQQKTDLPITKLISKVCTGYSKYFNKKNKRIGAVFQDQFKSVLIENNEQLLWTSYYIHKNPIEADLVRNPEDYIWSSYQEYFNPVNKFNLCNKEIIIEQFNSGGQYLKYFEDKEDDIGTSFNDLYFDFGESQQG